MSWNNVASFTYNLPFFFKERMWQNICKNYTWTWLFLSVLKIPTVWHKKHKKSDIENPIISLLREATAMTHCCPHFLTVWEPLLLYIYLFIYGTVRVFLLMSQLLSRWKIVQYWHHMNTTYYQAIRALYIAVITAFLLRAKQWCTFSRQPHLAFFF